ncbi:phage tail tape measure protein [Micromonospora sp. NPDC049891]|uniref:phage tail tape measure protein n=1 Tax=Micromonospora sp. NPDC049891 TaxID=3155655 RepID=UPI0033FC9C1B
MKVGVDNDGVSSGTREIESKFQKTWGRVKAGAALAGAGIGVALAAGAMKGLELDAARAKMEAQLGDPKLAAELGDIAGKVYGRGFAESAGAAMDAVRAVTSSGLVPDGDAAKIEELTVAAQAYATAWGGDVADAAQYASTLIGSGLAKDATHAMDLITVASRKVPAALREDVLEAGDEYSQFFRTLGFDGEQAFSVLVNASAKGKYGLDKAGDAIKEFTLRATDMSTTSVEAYEAIGLDAQKMSNRILAGGETAKGAFDQIITGLLGIKDPTEQANTAIGLFGTPLEDLNVADIPEFLKGLKASENSLGDVAGAAGKAGDALEKSTSQKLEAFKRQAEQALVATLERAVPAIASTFGWLQRNSGWVGPLAAGLGVLAAIIGTIIVITKVWTAVQTALNVVMAMNPIGLVVLAVVALIAIIALIATKTTWFQTLWKAVWGAAKATVEWVVNWIVGGWKWAFNTLSAGVRLWWSVFSGAWRKVGNFGRQMLQWIVDKAIAFNRFMTSLPGKMAGKLRSMFDPLKTSFRRAVNWIIGRWNGLSFTIGGGNFMGMNVPSMTLGTPNIPYLASGGIVPATPGGRLAVLGEGRHDEAVVPLPRGARDFANSGGGAHVVVEFRGGNEAADFVVETVRRHAKRKGGSVQFAYGR